MVHFPLNKKPINHDRGKTIGEKTQEKRQDQSKEEIRNRRLPSQLVPDPICSTACSFHHRQEDRTNVETSLLPTLQEMGPKK